MTGGSWAREFSERAKDVPLDKAAIDRLLKVQTLKTLDYFHRNCDKNNPLIYKNWHQPSLVATDANLKACKRFMRVLRRPTKDDCRIIRFKGVFSREQYKKAYNKIYKLWSEHPAIFAVIFQFMRILATVKKLDAKDLMRHECLNYASLDNNRRKRDRAIAQDIADLEMIFKKPRKTRTAKK